MPATVSSWYFWQVDRLLAALTCLVSQRVVLSQAASFAANGHVLAAELKRCRHTDTWQVFLFTSQPVNQVREGVIKRTSPTLLGTGINILGLDWAPNRYRPGSLEARGSS